MLHWIFERVNIYVILASLLVAGILIFAVGLLIFLGPAPAMVVQPGAAMTVIPAPTLTPVPTRVIETPTPTSPPAIDGIYVGSYVQITGTEGQGLRLRSGPRIDNPPRFLGMDAEVFQVIDGPKESDGFVWWYLEAPYDPGRSGWAASQYLMTVNNPTPTP